MSQSSVRTALASLSLISRIFTLHPQRMWYAAARQEWNKYLMRQIKTASSLNKESRKIISVSTIFQQDGLDIQELPILIRILDKNTNPLINYSYPGELIRPMTSEDMSFQYMAQECTSVRDVFRLLEIPSEKVTGYSAAAALQRMAELQKMNKDWDDLHSFIRTAVMNELFESVRRDAAQLTNGTLISLVSCYLRAENFSESCKEAISCEIEKRIVEEQLELAELCHLSNLLLSSNQSDQDMLNSIWVYIGNHFADISEENISLVLSSLPASHKYLLKVFGKQFHKFWWKMKSMEVVSYLSSLVKLNVFQVITMTDCARWLFLNIHQVTEDELKKFVAAFVHFQCSDAHLVKALERYIPAKGNSIDTDLLGLALEYCRSRRYFSPTILDAAAEHFCVNREKYSPLQMFTILRPFGQLNYLPKNVFDFLVYSEQMLMKYFNNFDTAQLIELLCSFAFVERIPLNFVQRVLTTSFLRKVKGEINIHNCFLLYL